MQPPKLLPRRFADGNKLSQQLRGDVTTHWTYGKVCIRLPIISKWCWLTTYLAPWSSFRCREGVPLINALVLGEW